MQLISFPEQDLRVKDSFRNPRGNVLVEKYSCKESNKHFWYSKPLDGMQKRGKKEIICWATDQ